LYSNKIKTASIFTSRGCTRNCSFCLSRDFWKKWRGRNPELVAAEINEIVEKTNIRRFIFQDNSFEDPGFDKERMKNIAHFIKQLPKKITFYTMMRAEAYKVLDTETIEDLKEAGWASVLLGIEAGNDADLKLFNKTATLDDNYKSIRYFRNNGIRPYIGFMC
jgi:anaerobic magnesium-protoporphyrin IX monomethyl ester cyclase